jgi:uncharacterized protein YjbI with pentapeptide repeats
MVGISPRCLLFVAVVGLSVGLGGGVCALEPPKDEKKAAAASVFAFELDRDIRLDVQSDGVEWHGRTYRLVELGSIRFQLDKKAGHLQASANATMTAFDRVDYDVGVAVFDGKGQLLGIARCPCSVPRVWMSRILAICQTIKFDFGISLDYERAASFKVAISKRRVLTPEQWKAASETKAKPSDAWPATDDDSDDVKPMTYKVCRPEWSPRSAKAGGATSKVKTFVSSSPSIPFELGRDILLGVESNPVTWEGQEYSLLWLRSIRFQLDKETRRLTAKIKAGEMTFDKVDYDVSGAVFDATGRLLGVSRADCSTSRCWVGKPICGRSSVRLDFGISLDYDRAASIMVAISKRAVLTPDAWGPPSRPRASASKGEPLGWPVVGRESLLNAARGTVPFSLGREYARSPRPQTPSPRHTAANDGVRDLRRMTFQSVGLGVSFRRADVGEATFKETQAAGLDFRHATLEGARFVKCRIPATSFVGANCKRIVFIDCNDICGDDFSCGDLKMARFVNCGMPAAKFGAADCTGAEFRDCRDICAADFGDADLRRARFVGCSMPAAHFVGAGCAGVVFQNCNNMCGDDFSDADLQDARFSGCSLPSARFLSANCSRARFVNCSDICGGDFRDASFAAARFSNCSLPGAAFAGAKCQGTSFVNCEITTGADFSDADLTSATFTNCRLSTARLANATFSGTVLNRCDLSGADLRGATLKDCTLVEPDLRGADLRGARFGDSLRGGKFDSRTLYNSGTEFPPGFDPVAKGLSRKD